MTPESRRALIDLASDRSQWVASKVFKAFHETGITEDEAAVFEKLLTRKTGATRSAAISMLASQSDAGAIASATRLLDAKRQEQRLGGLEVLRQLKGGERAADAVAGLVAGYRDQRARLSDSEITMLDYLAAVDTEEATLADGLGLFDPADLAVTVAPSKNRSKVSTPSHEKVLRAADALIERNRDSPITVKSGFGTEERLYGDQRWGLQPDPGADLGEAPLGELWNDWWRQQSVTPFDLERCLASAWQYDWKHHQSIGRKGLPARPDLNYPHQLDAALWWLWLEHGTGDGFTFLLDGFENALTMVPNRDLENPLIAPRGWGNHKLDWRANSPAVAWLRAINTASALRPDLINSDDIGRRWRLESWLDRPVTGVPRHRPPFALVLEARAAGWASDTDVMDHLIGPRSDSRMGYGWRGFDALRAGTRRRPADWGGPDAGLTQMVDAVRERVIDVELRRGDVATAASAPALVIRSVAGANRLVSLLKALGKGTFIRGWSWNADQKRGVLSHLIRVSYPNETDTPALFSELIAQASIAEKRLLERALYAPQWSRYVEHAVGWDGLEDAVYWLHAHTKDNSWSVDVDVREAWAAEIAGRTALTPIDLVDGGVDVDWFHRVLEDLGVERWEQLLAFIKYTSGGGGHKRAEMFGEALRGAVSVDALMERIRTKRHQDTVRALGLVPLSDDPAKQSDEVLARYQLFQEFKQGSRKFGSQKQASEKRAVEIGMDNLARTAGYADPIRLQWDMETLEAGDLANGPITLDRDPYTVELGIDGLGKAQLTVSKAGKRLKTVPAALRKDDEVVTMRERSTALRRQVSRVRASLEAASVFGDSFTGLELETLHRHPILRPMLAATLFVLPDGTVGLPADDGRNLRPIVGRKRKVGNRSVRPAHPVDLLASDRWSEWQHRLFVDEVKQPFKQVFRELYVPNAAETEDGKKSLRYAGHQVNPRQAAGIFGSRGWTTHPDGYTFKTFHREGLLAAVHFDGALFTPAEVDGATMFGLTFQMRGDYKPLDLEAIPPRLFSEVMRDLDLVVSVAHMGGVDPEASASTVEMRTALVRETAMLLNLDNVRFSGSHVMVDGKIGNYSIHLGSGQVHRQPGGAVCIIPVGSQHRGRLFLPFADDDPRTAEVVSKAVLLANDDQIKDPTILEQIL